MSFFHSLFTVLPGFALRYSATVVMTADWNGRV